jgi:hypothetical protein
MIIKTKFERKIKDDSKFQTHATRQVLLRPRESITGPNYTDPPVVSILLGLLDPPRWDVQTFPKRR